MRRTIEELQTLYADKAPRGHNPGSRRNDVTDAMVSAALKSHAGSVMAAAKQLGLSHVTVYNRLKAMRALAKQGVPRG